MATTIATLQKMKAEGKKITSLTAYDASFAKLFIECGIDFMLVGDSLGNVVQGRDSTIPVSVDDICYHTEAVRRGAPAGFVVADLPFMSYSQPEQAYQNAARLMQAGANMVKLEGGEWLEHTIQGLVTRGVPVCAHLGLLPQSVNVLGGYKVQAKEQAQADATLAQAQKLEQAGAQLLVLECIPASLGKRISEALSIPTIGIGAGADTDGQILVMHDMLGLNSDYLPKFTKDFLAGQGSLRNAIIAFRDEVQQGQFPAPEHSYR
ncbi:3-methyl-2-oxobutanoate hydroxymethyltransferase [Idiomarina tyrosinivorans]|uniref:3-methyl-2-oxobutanoate hydroxymethyltransferase n=1 Tax=Idiomarina tyrosinivorans TaxID=1445662 RepID=A0A432ZS55_9GAMM|nr:3-methyl-2-oxobutanoate hydroxymethyltransferase [Idiomarina tyrosinivorans]RUO80666.1 3-methyl-2-oxobutanoate hydroxymethyltransferase [Idiomarina tyrosinivorans]